MIEYELINPSDPYTFLAKTKESAALTVFLLGTMYGASKKDDNEEKRIPVDSDWNEIPDFQEKL